MISERQLFLNHVAQTSEDPMMLEIEKANGVFLYDKSGKQLIDFISGISVSSLGHNNPKIKNAIKQQLDNYSYLMVYGEFVQSPQVKLATKLNEVLPENLNSAFFVNSGSEAVEGALKLAKRYTGRSEIVSFKNAYHGSSHGALSVMGNEYFRNAYRPLLPGVSQLEFNSVEQLKNITTKTACAIVEVVQGEAGVRLANHNFIKALRKKCTETGTLLIFDEIQTGMGRTGKMFSFEHYGVSPDIMTLAKAFGGGMPIGAFVSSKEIMSCLSKNPVLGHISTFGGHAVCCVAALKSLEILSSEKIIDKVEGKARLIKKLLQHEEIKEIRNLGLLMAVELKHADFTIKVIKKAVELGLVTDWFLFAPECIRIAPPLIINEDEIKKACSIIVDSINQVLKEDKLL